MLNSDMVRSSSTLTCSPQPKLGHSILTASSAYARQSLRNSHFLRISGSADSKGLTVSKIFRQPLCFQHFRAPLGSADSKELTDVKIFAQTLLIQYLRARSGSAGNKRLITPLESALTRNAPVTLLESALTKNLGEGVPTPIAMHISPFPLRSALVLPCRVHVQTTLEVHHAA